MRNFVAVLGKFSLFSAVLTMSIVLLADAGAAGTVVKSNDGGRPTKGGGHGTPQCWWTPKPAGCPGGSTVTGTNKPIKCKPNGEGCGRQD